MSATTALRQAQTTDLPRSRALVRLDGPGHIMPVEPVTPPGSALWRVIHLPSVLGVVAAGLLLAAVLAVRLLGLGFQLLPYVPGARYVVPPIGAAAVAAAYWVFVRVVERRPVVDELGGDAGGRELGLGLGGGLALAVLTFAGLALAGDVRVVGTNPPRVLLLPLVVQLCSAIVVEIIANGLFFRLVERSLGSWLTLALVALAAAVVPLAGGDASAAGVLAVVLEVGLACAAAYMVTRRLWAAIGLYAAWNFAQVALYGTAFGENGPQGLLLAQVTGPDWLTGGAASTDASAPALLLNALAAAVLLGIAVRRGRIVRPAWQRGRR